MRGISVFICVLLVLLGTTTAQAQKISVFGHVSIPYGDFGSTTTNEAGFAKTGFGGGVEVGIPINIGGALGFSPEQSNTYIIGQVRILSNPIDDGPLSEMLYNELYWYYTYGDVELMALDVNIDKYVNIPVMGGGSVEINTSPNVMIFFKGLMGVNISMYPDYEVPMTLYDYAYHQYYSIEMVAEADGVGYSFCLNVGAGAAIGDRFDLGIEMLLLGTPEFDGKVSMWSEGLLIDSTHTTFAQSMAVVNLTAGIRF